MRPEEAQKLSRIILNFRDESAQNLKILNIGSSTAHFREVIQPHVKTMLIDPCENVGCIFINHDIKHDIGVDIVGDLLDTKVVDVLKNLDCDIIVASNILEHIERAQLDNFIVALKKIVAKGKVVIITVPFSYPIHFDPIDTYFRPSPDELVSFFTGFCILDRGVLSSGPYWNDFVKLPAWGQVRILTRLLLPFYKPKSWLSVAHRFLWLFRKYQITFVVLRNQGGCKT
ncbi:class I SAM-dependent methyltransferase [Alphaproteobacteria bacterium]|nr:class I SAM-dependent methyltransferase [Alphaproteobacteria bacterium]